MEIRIGGYDEAGDPVDLVLELNEDEGLGVYVSLPSDDENEELLVGPVFVSSLELKGAVESLHEAA